MDDGRGENDTRTEELGEVKHGSRDRSSEDGDSLGDDWEHGAEQGGDEDLGAS